MQRFNKYVETDRSGAALLRFSGTEVLAVLPLAAKFIPRLVRAPKLEDVSREESGETR